MDETVYDYIISGLEKEYRNLEDQMSALSLIVDDEQALSDLEVSDCELKVLMHLANNTSRYMQNVLVAITGLKLANGKLFTED